MKDHKEQIEQIMADMDCPNYFDCCKSGLEKVPTPKFVADFLRCRYEKPAPCKFAMSFGHGWFCKCPLRNHLAEKFLKTPQQRYDMNGGA